VSRPKTLEEMAADLGTTKAGVLQTALGMLEEGLSRYHPVLFLDIDGVLNGHEKLQGSPYCGVRADCMARLNRIVRETGCRFVLASSWRYMVLLGQMTLKGFEYLMITHGLIVPKVRDIVKGEGAPVLFRDTLPEDRTVNDLHDRGKLARAWLDAHPEVKTYAALDDGNTDGLDLGYEVMGIPSVRPVPSVGLTDALADRVIALLRR